MNLTHTPVSKLETSLADLEPIYQTIASAQARLIAKGSCLDGLYSVGILLQYIARLKETIGPWETWKHDYFAMKHRAQTAEYAAQDLRHTALEIEVAKDERIIQWQNNNAVMQTQLQQAEAAANYAERALHKLSAEHSTLQAENKIISDNAVAQPSTERELQIAALRQDVRLKFAATKLEAWPKLPHGFN